MQTNLKAIKMAKNLLPTQTPLVVAFPSQIRWFSTGMIRKDPILSHLS